jgi:tetratricopeptide (TPR) repeat protein
MAKTRPLTVGLVALLLLAGCAGLIADSIDALMKQGIDLFLARKYDEAIAKFLEVVRRDPKFWNAYLYMARSYLGKGSWGDAIASGRKALELAPSSTEVVTSLAEAFLGAGSCGRPMSRATCSSAVRTWGRARTPRPCA